MRTRGLRLTALCWSGYFDMMAERPADHLGTPPHGAMDRDFDFTSGWFTNMDNI